ncbi:MAG: class I SAM-dependent methyltransferase [Kiritimatiellae bacterium]|nr:class I SAM-dependent methyltransferase [Kiritimatiellia bacterium]
MSDQNDSTTDVVVLKPGRDESLRRRHPWVFSGAVDGVEGSPMRGATVDVASADGEWLARGGFCPESQIVVRAWTFDPDEAVDREFLRRRLQAAVAARAGLGDVCRLVNAESDGLPGLTVDHYAGQLVAQFSAAGAEYWKKEITDLLLDIVSCAGIYERSDVDVRTKDGLAPASGVLAGSEPPDLIEISEGECRFVVDLKHGHKTGFYLDQRENRGIVAGYARGREVLNCFSYTGAFGVCALKAGAARVVNVESSAAALELGRRNVDLNGLDASRVEHIEGDVFHVLRKFRDSRRSFDLVILDPPKFVDSRRQLAGGCRGYKDINLLAFKLLRPGGILATFSCSGLVGPDLFQKIVADAALDAGRSAQIVRRLAQAADHPVALSFPEGGYLKGLVCRVE